MNLKAPTDERPVRHQFNCCNVSSTSVQPHWPINGLAQTFRCELHPISTDLANES